MERKKFFDGGMRTLFFGLLQKEKVRVRSEHQHGKCKVEGQKKEGQMEGDCNNHKERRQAPTWSGLWESTTGFKKSLQARPRP